MIKNSLVRLITGLIFAKKFIPLESIYTAIQSYYIATVLSLSQEPSSEPSLIIA